MSLSAANEPDNSHADWELVIVGAGAAGLMAAIRAAEAGCRVLLVEKNRRPGIKILMSGGTRCNITHATDNRGIIDAYGPPGRFLHSALAALSVQQTIDLFEAEGVATKVESTGKIFPVSDRATDVLAALMARLQRSGCPLTLEEGLVDLHVEPPGFRLVTTHRELRTARVLITTGGQSFPGCGTIGEGYRWAASLGHTVIPPRPALVPITVAEPWARALQGVTIPDVALRVVEPPPKLGGNSGNSNNDAKEPPGKARCLAQARGSLLFTHFGLSGPVVLDVSRAVSGHPQPQSLRLECDFWPEQTPTQLEEAFTAATADSGKKSLVSILPERLPRRLLDQFLAAVELPPDRRAAEVGKRDRARLAAEFKRCVLRVTGTLGFKKAEVTAGGVALDEVDSRTMQSKLVPGLYFAGEVLDLDGPIGGYNFQAAWSTGWLAGAAASLSAR